MRRHSPLPVKIGMQVMLLGAVFFNLGCTALAKTPATQLAATPSIAHSIASTTSPSTTQLAALPSLAAAASPSAAEPDFDPKIGKIFSESTVNTIFEMLRQGLTAAKNKDATPTLSEEQKKNLAQMADKIQGQTAEMGLEMLKHNEQAFKEMFKDMK